MIKKHFTRGYVALISVLIVAALLLAVSIGVSVMSISGAYMSLDQKNAVQAEAYVSSCVYKAMLSLKSDLEYEGNEDIMIGEGSCHVEQVGGTGNEDRIIRVMSTVGDVVYRAEVLVDTISPDTSISSWKKVSNF